MCIITPEDLVQYLYEETPLQKTEVIKAAFENDWSLREAFEQLVYAQKELEELQLSPRKEAIKRLFDHADNTINHLHPH